MLEAWMGCSAYNPWFWLNYWWNRLLCVFGFHYWVTKIQSDDCFCLICHEEL